MCRWIIIVKYTDKRTGKRGKIKEERSERKEEKAGRVI